MEYIEKIRYNSAESYQLFYEQYANLLIREYNIYISRFNVSIDDIYEFLISNHEDLNLRHTVPVDFFPLHMQEYLRYTFGREVSYANISPILELFKDFSENTLPSPRQKDIVYKYEDNNPYKEQGLKAFFERIAHYSFISRLQTYRYLSNNKASADKIDVISADCLGGIFTNKQKSIYYYIFLTEADETKANNACKVLNFALYGK